MLSIRTLDQQSRKNGELEILMGELANRLNVFPNHEKIKSRRAWWRNGRASSQSEEATTGFTPRETSSSRAKSNKQNQARNERRKTNNSKVAYSRESMLSCRHVRDLQQKNRQPLNETSGLVQPPCQDLHMQNSFHLEVCGHDGARLLLKTESQIWKLSLSAWHFHTLACLTTWTMVLTGVPGNRPYLALS